MKKNFTLLVMALTMNAFSQIPTTGLKAHYQFNGNANDNTGNGNNGIVSGATLTTDRFGNANSSYLFNGINNKITLTNANLSLPDSFSISSWVRINNLSPSNYDAPIISQWNGTSVGQRKFAVGYRRMSTQIGMSLYLCNNSNTQFDYYPINWNPQASTWYHFVTVFKPGVYVKTYVNGVLHYSNTTSIPAVLTTPTNPQLEIGHMISSLGNYWFNGSIDDICIYDRILNTTEINSLYNESSQNICSAIGQDSTMLYNNGYITGPQASGSYPIHTDSKWVKVTGADSLRVNTIQHRFYDMSKIYDKNNNLIWQWGGESVPATTWYTRNHSVYVGGNDSVRIEFYQGYTNFSVGHLQITKMICGSVATSINAIDKNIKFNIYPNPATDQLMIEFSNDNIENFRLNIFNTLGQIVITTYINNQFTNVNLSSLASNGIYFVQIEDAENKLVTVKKIIIQ